MIYDLDGVQKDPFEEKIYDVCIIGGGIAGITLAMYLKKELNILLLEGGGLEFSMESQDIYKGKNIGFPYLNLEDVRARYLGGTSHYWSGKCAVYSSYSFAIKDFVKYSGWPIEKKDLDPFLEESKSVLDLPTPHKQEYYEGWTDVLDGQNDNFDSAKFLYSIPPINFKMKYESELRKRTNIDCYVNANLTDMTMIEKLSSVDTVEIQNYQNGVFKVSAKKYILATGGIENARLLLNFNKQCKKGIGNDNDLVGRFFSDHPHIDTGYFVVEDHVKKAFEGKDKPIEMLYSESCIVTSEKLQKEERILPVGIHIKPKADLFTPLVNSFKENIRDLACLTDWTHDLAIHIREKEIRCGNIDGKISHISDQAPNPSSRVTLGTETDRFGLRHSVLDWQFLEIDTLTQKKVAMSFAENFAQLGLGRVKLFDWMLSTDTKFPDKGAGACAMGGGYHHMCTTRMGISSKTGVVDGNQKVFNVDNLYVAGSSVFATPGEHNPTLTIVQMTLRLADHLNY